MSVGWEEWNLRNVGDGTRVGQMEGEGNASMRNMRKARQLLKARLGLEEGDLPGQSTASSLGNRGEKKRIALLSFVTFHGLPCTLGKCSQVQYYSQY